MGTTTLQGSADATRDRVMYANHHGRGSEEPQTSEERNTTCLIADGQGLGATDHQL